jgi:hypothetical protein
MNIAKGDKDSSFRDNLILSRIRDGRCRCLERDHRVVHGACARTEIRFGAPHGAGRLSQVALVRVERDVSGPPFFDIGFLQCAESFGRLLFAWENLEPESGDESQAVAAVHRRRTRKRLDAASLDMVEESLPINKAVTRNKWLSALLCRRKDQIIHAFAQSGGDDFLLLAANRTGMCRSRRSIFDAEGGS